jgi:hypothetical protein
LYCVVRVDDSGKPWQSGRATSYSASNPARGNNIEAPASIPPDQSRSSIIHPLVVKHPQQQADNRPFPTLDSCELTFNSPIQGSSAAT